MGKGGKGHIRVAESVFDLAQMVIDGRPRRAMRLYCYRCGKPGTCLMNTMNTSTGVDDDREKQIVARKFTSMGWEVDLRKGKHFCPECQISPQVKMEKQEVELAVVPMPRQMTRDDRRIVFEKLNDVYLDEKQGYSPPWTDEKVSVDLGVPRAWVTNVREEMFGPVGSNSDIEAAIKSACELVVEMKKGNEQIAKLMSSAATIEKRLDQIIKAVRP
jgi:hypothetical protein